MAPCAVPSPPRFAPVELATRAKGCPDPFAACLGREAALALDENLRAWRLWQQRVLTRCAVEGMPAELRRDPPIMDRTAGPSALAPCSR